MSEEEREYLEPIEEADRYLESAISILEGDYQLNEGQILDKVREKIKEHFSIGESRE